MRKEIDFMKIYKEKLQRYIKIFNTIIFRNKNSYFLILKMEAKKIPFFGRPNLEIKVEK